MPPEPMRSSRVFFAAISLLAAMLAEPSVANAQSNYRIAPIGGRSQLLGGTGMVYGRDATASFMNPATAVLVDDRRLSFAVNFYTMSFVYAPRWYVPGPIDRSKFGTLRINNSTMTDLEFNALPSSLCIFFKGGDAPSFAKDKDLRTRESRFGFCVGTVQGQTFNFAAEGFSETNSPSVTRQAQTLAQSYQRFAGGPTYAMYINNALSIGMSVHASLASHRSLLAASATTYGSSPNPINSMFYTGARGDSFQLEGVVGATLRFGKQTVGLSIKSPSLHVFGVGGANRQYHYDGAGSETSVLSTSGSFVSRSPMRIGIGTGVEQSWGVAELNAFFSPATDASYSAELEGTTVDTRDGVVTDRPISLSLAVPARAVVNVAVGAEIFLSDRISLMTGAFTDLSAVKQGGLRGDFFNYYPSRTHRVGLSGGIASHGPGGELMIGGELSAGWGERLAVNSYQLPPEIGTTGHGTYQLMFVIAGSTSLMNIRRAMEDVTDVLKDPKGKPKNPYTPKPQPSDPNKLTPAKTEPYNPRKADEEDAPSEPPPPTPRSDENKKVVPQGTIPPSIPPKP